MYQILAITCTVLSGVITFFLIRVANTFIQMGKDITEIKIELRGHKTVQDGHASRIERVEKILKIA